MLLSSRFLVEAHHSECFCESLEKNSTSCENHKKLWFRVTSNSVIRYYDSQSSLLILFQLSKVHELYFRNLHTDQINIS